MATFLTVLHPRIEEFHLNTSAITHFTDRLLEETGRPGFSLSLVFVDDAEIQIMNNRYRHKNKPTNVLSFPFTGDPDYLPQELTVRELGDIVISLDTAKREALEYEEDFCFRLCWLIIHGLLHLCGMDHERSEQEAKEMADREQEMIKKYYHIVKAS